MHGSYTYGNYTLSYKYPKNWAHAQTVCTRRSLGMRLGWIVIQCWVPNGTVNFTRGWKDYEEEFGDLDSEFWYGLRNIHCLTTRESVELRIDLQDEQGNKVTHGCTSSLVWMGLTRSTISTLDRELGHHQGQMTPWPTIITCLLYFWSLDAMAVNNDSFFSTFNHDNDNLSGENCAVSYRGAWWYQACVSYNLNGSHIPITPPPPSPTVNHILWYNGSKWIYLLSTCISWMLYVHVPCR